MVDEMRTAIPLERRFSQDQLLEIYRNRAYFGAETYGVESAAGALLREAHRGSLDRGVALLVGLIARPTYFSPTQHPDRVVARRNEVLDRMMQRGSIRREEADSAKRNPLGPIQN